MFDIHLCTLPVVKQLLLFNVNSSELEFAFENVKIDFWH